MRMTCGNTPAPAWSISPRSRARMKVNVTDCLAALFSRLERKVETILPQCNIGNWACGRECASSKVARDQDAAHRFTVRHQVAHIGQKLTNSLLIGGSGLEFDYDGVALLILCREGDVFPQLLSCIQ